MSGRQNVEEEIFDRAAYLAGVPLAVDPESFKQTQVPSSLYSLVACAQLYRGMGHISDDEYALFLEKSINFIISDVMNIRIHGLVLTTSEYRNAKRILSHLAQKYSYCIGYADLPMANIRSKVEEDDFFVNEFNEVANLLNFPDVDEKGRQAFQDMRKAFFSVFQEWRSQLE